MHSNNNSYFGGRIFAGLDVLMQNKRLTQRLCRVFVDDDAVLWKMRQYLDIVSGLEAFQPLLEAVAFAVKVTLVVIVVDGGGVFVFVVSAPEGVVAGLASAAAADLLCGGGGGGSSVGLGRKRILCVFVIMHRACQSRIRPDGMAMRSSVNRLFLPDF